MKASKRYEGLSEQSEDYGRMIRWGHFHDAIAYQRSPDGPTDTADVDSLRDVRVTSYQILRTEFSEDGKEAVVDAVVEYHYEPQNVVKATRDRQRWWYHEEDKRWYLDGGLPDFGPQD